MKLVVLAATVGYVLGAVGDDCGTLAGGDTPCGDTTNNYCNLAGQASEDTDGSDANSGLCAAKIVAGAACVADGDCVSGDCDASTCRLATGGTCTANGECLDTDYCATDTCTTKIADGETCVADDDCQTGTCEGPCGLTLTCGANANADGDLGGCCGGDNNIAVTDSANYCLNGVVTAKVADDGVCSVALTGGDCVSGSCTATSADDDDADVGACDAATTTTTEAPAPAAGETGGACRTVVEGSAEVTGCGTDLTCSTDGGDGVVFCQNTDGEPASIDSAADAGTLGGVCTAAEVTAVTACDGTDVCNESVCGAATEAPTDETDAPTDDTDDSPAAIFYGMSMVTGAIAYLL